MSKTEITTIQEIDYTAEVSECGWNIDHFTDYLDALKVILKMEKKLPGANGRAVARYQNYAEAIEGAPEIKVNIAWIKIALKAFNDREEGKEDWYERMIRVERGLPEEEVEVQQEEEIPTGVPVSASVTRLHKEDMDAILKSVRESTAVVRMATENQLGQAIEDINHNADKLIASAVKTITKEAADMSVRDNTHLVKVLTNMVRIELDTVAGKLMTEVTLALRNHTADIRDSFREYAGMRPLPQAIPDTFQETALNGGNEKIPCTFGHKKGNVLEDDTMIQEESTIIKSGASAPVVDLEEAAAKLQESLGGGKSKYKETKPAPLKVLVLDLNKEQLGRALTGIHPSKMTVDGGTWENVTDETFSKYNFVITSHYTDKSIGKRFQDGAREKLIITTGNYVPVRSELQRLLKEKPSRF